MTIGRRRARGVRLLSQRAESRQVDAQEAWTMAETRKVRNYVRRDELLGGSRRTDAQGREPEQDIDATAAIDQIDSWMEQWGRVGSPSSRGHAMYLILDEVNGAPTGRSSGWKGGEWS